MATKKDKRRKLARKVIREYVKTSLTDPYVLDSRLTESMTDAEFDRLIREIKKARVTVRWSK